jgi:hypothetical protein
MTFQQIIRSERNNLLKHKLPLAVFTFTLFILSFVQVKLSDHPIILLERFFKGGGWPEIVIIAAHTA